MATFVFALIGLPMAIITRRGEAVVSFSLAMGIVALYYILFVWGRAMAVEGEMSPVICLWFPTVLMAACGAILMRRILSH